MGYQCMKQVKGDGRICIELKILMSSVWWDGTQVHDGQRNTSDTQWFSSQSIQRYAFRISDIVSWSSKLSLRIWTWNENAWVNKSGRNIASTMSNSKNQWEHKIMNSATIVGNFDDLMSQQHRYSLSPIGYCNFYSHIWSPAHLKLKGWKFSSPSFRHLASAVFLRKPQSISVILVLRIPRWFIK